MHRLAWILSICLTIAITVSGENKFAEPKAKTVDPKCKEAITTNLAPFEAVLSQCYQATQLYYTGAQEICRDACRSTTQQAAAVVSAGCEEPLDAANPQIQNPNIAKRSFSDDQSHLYAAWGTKDFVDAACAPSSKLDGRTCLDEYKEAEFALESGTLQCNPCIKNLVQTVGVPGREPRTYMQDVSDSTALFNGIRQVCGI